MDVAHEKDVTINWPTAFVVTVIPLIVVGLIITIMVLHYDDKQQTALLEADNNRWKMLYTKMQDGCANPNNQLATIQIIFKPGQLWSCTPFFKQRQAPKVPDGNKRKRVS